MKGLNACHVAAADKAGAEWFVTVDADTRLLPSALEAEFDERFLLPHFRLDWQSRNPANGLISGNGSLKLWSDDMARRMKSHEAAPEGKVSLDADIGDIEPGKSRLIQMAGCHSISDPAITPYHAFRVGFRETVFLNWLLQGVRENDGPDSGPAKTLSRLIAIWSSLGLHRENGAWLVYGARLGLWTSLAWPDWDVRDTTNYDWFQKFWSRNVLPRFSPGGATCPLTNVSWDVDRLATEVQHLGQRLLEHDDIDFEIADFSAAESALIVEAEILPTIRTAQNMDSLGTAYNRGRIVPQDCDFANTMFDVAALMHYPAAINNIARQHKLGSIAGADRDQARRYYELATALGNQHAPFHLAGFLLEERGTRDAEIDALFALASDRGFVQGVGR